MPLFLKCDLQKMKGSDVTATVQSEGILCALRWLGANRLKIRTDAFFTLFTVPIFVSVGLGIVMFWGEKNQAVVTV